MKLTRAQIAEIKKFRSKLTNEQLYNHLTSNFGLKTGFTSFRTALYKLKIFKTNLLRWTLKEKNYLRANYKTKGNKEIAADLSKKNRIFTVKHVNKQMKLLFLKRTPEELRQIKENHKAKGVYKNASARIKATGKRYYPEGHIKVIVSHGRPSVMIKVNGIFVHYLRHRYKELYGSVPDGWKVYPKDYNFRNISDENIVAMPASGHNSEERKKYQKFYQEYFAELEQQNPKVVKIEKNEVLPEPVQALVPVRIGKVIIKVKPGTNIEELKKKYEMRSHPSAFITANVNMKTK